jgi:acetyl esterase/lipase
MSTLLTPSDYPAQEPATSPAAAEYRAEVMRRCAGIEGLDCRYGDDIYQRVALFIPPRPTGPVLAYMHGGGWTSGFKEMMAFMAPAFVDAGITFASVGYRLAPAHVFPASFMDVAAGTAWIYRHAGQIIGTPPRIFIGGHSAGGHYAALLAVRRDWQAPLGLPTDVIQGCLPVSGVYDFTASSGLSMRPRFLGHQGNGAEHSASPLHSIQARPPPFLMAHGENDFPHLIKQAEAMETALRAAGGEVERIVLPGRTHFTASLATSEPDMPWLSTAKAWIDSRLVAPPA